MAVSDIVLLKQENTSRNVWPMVRITSTKPDSEGFVRSVFLKTSTTELHRPISKLVLLLKREEVQNLDT